MQSSKKPLPEITIINQHHYLASDSKTSEYIGRGSPLGNPFTHMQGTTATALVKDREAAVEAYGVWLREEIQKGNIQVIQELDRLAYLAMEQGHLTLRCFCAPKRCHGEVIRDVLLTAIKDAQQPMIDQFKGEYRFLSNFYPAVVDFEGIAFPSVEHAYVAAKTLDRDIRANIARVGTAREAKTIGRMLKLRPDWCDVRLPIMEDLVRQKFTKWPWLGEALLATGDRHLVEGNWWRDTFWGVDLKTRKGENHLGKILMKIRSELQ